MTSSETKFRNWAKKRYPGALIKKIPDFKMMGGSGGAAVGLPDYVIFWKDETYWWEVKSGFGDTINHKNHLTPAQIKTFHKMEANGIKVHLWCLTKTVGAHIVRYNLLERVGSMKFIEEQLYESRTIKWKNV